ncbi:MAG: hypothetical protein ACE5HC_11135 [Candidatus Binatia bacterium]
MKRYEVIVDLFKKLRTNLKTTFVDNRKLRTVDPVCVLKVLCLDLSCLVEQIDAHAGDAPYPHVAQRLRQMALQKQKNVNLISETILRLHGTVEKPSAGIKSGKNHWERIRRDIEDQKAIESNLLESSALLAEQAPEIGTFLRSILATEARHKEALVDLIMRADPQADQT